MPFATSIQELTGAHIGSLGQCAVDWVRNNVFTLGSYVASYGILTGTEQAFIDLSTFTYPAGGSFGSVPISIDANGDPYITWFAGGGGGLIQIDGMTLAQLATGGANLSPPSGFILLGGEVINVPFSSHQYMLAITEGGSTYRYYVIYDEVTYAGLYGSFGAGITPRSAALCCAGKSGTDIGFVVAGPQSVADTQKIVILKIHCSTPSVSTLATFIPTDINGTWTGLYPVGVCTDQTDGNILLWCQNNGGGATGAALVKVDANTGAIIWNTTVPVCGFDYMFQFSYSSILHQSLGLITTNFGTTTVTTVNTSSGSASSTTTGFVGVGGNGSFCYNDTLGAFVLATGFLQEGGGPALLNSTPSSFNSWAVLYANPAFVPPSIVTRRFLAEAGPIRVIA